MTKSTSNSLEGILELKRRIEWRKSEYEQTKGALQQVMKALKEESGCRDLAGAERLRQRLLRENAELKKHIEVEQQRLERELDEHRSR